MDEMISAGDLQFIEKAKLRLHEIIGRACILALASHDLQMIRSVCNKVLWLEHGAIKLLGEPEAVVRAYEGTGESMPAIVGARAELEKAARE
jgi:ABC-type polysaccharide/polyol phosphate transport system ATPase subunit